MVTQTFDYHGNGSRYQRCKSTAWPSEPAVSDFIFLRTVIHVCDSMCARVVFVTPIFIIRNGGYRAMSPFVQAAPNTSAQSLPLFRSFRSVNMACCTSQAQCRKISTTESLGYSIAPDASCSPFFFFRAKFRYSVGFKASRLSETGSGADMLTSRFLSSFSLAR